MFYEVLLCFVLLQVLAKTSYGQEKNAFFRKDYTFLEDTQSFYKIHTVHRTWQDAKRRCAMEGSQMFYAEDTAEANAVLAHWKKTQPFSWVYVGISDLLSKGDFETIDGKPVVDIYSNWGPGEPNDADGNEDCVILRRDGTLNDDKCTRKYPFICKKSFASLEWNIFCDMPDITYLYNGDMGKCYKFHLDPANWTEAYSICSAEQSYLAILNSQKEHDFLLNMTAEAPKEKAPTRNYLSGVVHLGFHNKDQEGWKTIKGVPLTESGYSHWGGGQPDGGEKEPCGSMFFVGGLNDLGCHHKAFFICEHDIGTLNTDVDERRKKAKQKNIEKESSVYRLPLPLRVGLSYLAALYAYTYALQFFWWL